MFQLFFGVYCKTRNHVSVQENIPNVSMSATWVVLTLKVFVFIFWGGRLHKVPYYIETQKGTYFRELLT